MFLHRLVLILLLGCTQPLLAATALLPLEHRSAEELLPAVQALLDEGETLVAHDNQLLVRASLERINELRGILSQLDVPARQLLISVDNGSGRMPGYRVLAPADAPARPAPRVITAGPSDLLQIRASEGQPAFLELTRSEPRLGFTAGLDGTPYLLDLESESGIGLHLVARLRGDRQVQLDLSARRGTTDPAHPGARDTLLGETRLNGRLGEWISVAGSGDLLDRRDRLTTRGEESRPLRIRVELLD